MIKNCKSAQSCKIFNPAGEVEEIKCSDNGKCFYDIYHYLKSNKTDPFQNCVCVDGYTNLSSNDEVKCCYEQYSQFIAFLLEVLVGFGLGHFYIGNYQFGYLKLISYLIFCCSSYTIACCFCNKDENYSLEGPEDEEITKFYENHGIKIEYQYSLKLKIFNLFMIFSACIVLIWHLVDGLLFGLNYFNDSNRIQLKGW